MIEIVISKVDPGTEQPPLAITLTLAEWQLLVSDPHFLTPEGKQARWAVVRKFDGLFFDETRHERASRGKGGFVA